MPRIYVEFSRLDQIGSQCKSVASKVDAIQEDFQRTVRQLDWDICFESNINSIATQLSRKLAQYSNTLEAFQYFIADAHNEYIKLDEYNKLNLANYISPVPLNPNWFIPVGPDGNPGVTAWIGKASAEAQNEWGYAGVNAYLGKGEAAAKADAGIMKTTTKKEYQDGKWVEKSSTDFITAEVGASASVSALAGDAEAGLGSDMLGIEGKAEGAVGTAKAEAKGKFSVGEDGVNVNVKGEAMVAAVEGEAKGTINILGLEITGKVGGYAGAVGVEGKVGIEDNKFVLDGGAAALIGGSAGIEIGFNDEGWDDFVDFIIFWD